MSDRAALAFRAALLALPLIGLSLKAVDPERPEFNRSDSIQYIERLLRKNGLEQSIESKIEISHETVGTVFRAVKCRGAFLVVPLPTTAQSFDHVIGGFKYDVGATGFVYRGRVYGTYPYIRRIADQILYALRVQSSARGPAQSTVYSFKEFGSCYIAAHVNWNLSVNN